MKSQFTIILPGILNSRIVLPKFQIILSSLHFFLDIIVHWCALLIQYSLINKRTWHGQRQSKINSSTKIQDEDFSPRALCYNDELGS